MALVCVAWPCRVGQLAAAGRRRRAGYAEPAGASCEVASGHVSIVATAPSATPAVEFDRVSLAFDDRVVLCDVSFSVPAGAMKILFGASGAGKSMVLKLILGLVRPDAGRILVDGVRIDTMSEHELMGIRAGIGMLFQESATLHQTSSQSSLFWEL